MLMKHISCRMKIRSVFFDKLVLFFQVIRNALEPPQVPQSDLLKPKLTYETLCYEAFEFIEQNFKQSR